MCGVSSKLQELYAMPMQLTQILMSKNHFEIKTLQTLVQHIKTWGRELGFQQVGITDTDLSQHEEKLQEWLRQRYHGNMHYMEAHGSKRSRPAELIAGTLRVISVRLDYLPADTEALQVLNNPQQAYISRYALGRDYHKLMRKRLAALAQKIESYSAAAYNYRAFVDSAPVLERALAEKAGLGWIGKNTLLLNSKAGSWFFLGEIYTDLPLPIDSPQTSKHCGSCHACIDICPTNAFVKPWVLDARRCISYLTIESKDSIPLELRPLMGNRVFGCDDCQLVCPWNRFAKATPEKDFTPRHGLQSRELLDLFNWSEAEYLRYTEGSAMRRIGYERWLRNLAVGLGNADYSAKIVQGLTARIKYPSELVREHVAWALNEQMGKLNI